METTQGLQTEIQADRQTDPKWLCQSVHDQLVHDSTVTHLHLTTAPTPNSPCVVAWTIQTLHPTLHMCLRGDVTWRATGHVLVVGSFLFLTLCSLCLAVVPLWNASSPVHAAVLHMPARTPMPNWTSCTVTLVYCDEYYCYNTYIWKEDFIFNSSSAKPARRLTFTPSVLATPFRIHHFLYIQQIFDSFHQTSVLSANWIHS